MKKIYRMIILITTEQKEKLKRLAREERVTVPEFCRRRLPIKENLITR